MGRGYLRQRRQLENTQTKLKEANDRYLGATHQSLFTYILDHWDQENSNDGMAILGSLVPNSREAMACEVLFRLTGSDQARRLDAIKTQDELFYGFVRAELLFRHGDLQNSRRFYTGFLDGSQENNYQLLRLRAKLQIRAIDKE